MERKTIALGSTNIGFEEKLWQAADKLRSNMDSAEYKHVVLGLIFLKYVSDSFEEKYQVLLEKGGGDEEDRNEYLADNIFWVPKEARWSEIQKHTASADIGSVIDHAMGTIKNENNSLVENNKLLPLERKSPIKKQHLLIMTGVKSCSLMEIDVV